MEKIKTKGTSMSVDEVANELGVGVRTIVNYLHSKKLIGHKVGKKWFINKDSFGRFQDSWNLS